MTSTTPHPTPDFSLLRCPQCGSGLALASETEICCKGGEPHRFPLVRGIPRFAGEAYINSFGIQWNRYDVVRPEMDTATFQAKTGVNPDELSGLKVLDAGVGGGRYARLLGHAGANVVGLDLSSAVDKARENCRSMPNVVIAQADLLNPPIAAESFDFAYSIGVLHHCPDPRRAFARVARAVKPGGRMAVWLYRKNTLPQELANSALRGVTTRLPDKAIQAWARLLEIPGRVPVLKQVGSKIINFSTFADRGLRICDNYDWYAPQYQSHHSLAELRQWFVEEGFSEPVELRPEKTGRLYEWCYDQNLIIGSGVNMWAQKK
ncbi:MAG: methyltransferase domain-containing protein [Isosphaeraceae bacterium]